MTKINFAKTETDYETIANLADTIWNEYYTEIIGARQVDYMLKKYQTVPAIKDQVEDGAEYFLISHQGCPVGYLSFYKKKDTLFLNKLYILSTSRRKGIGRKAMQFVQTKAEQLGYVTISLTVNKNNISAISAYDRMGFKQVRDVVIDIGNDFVMDDYIMEKEI